MKRSFFTRWRWILPCGAIIGVGGSQAAELAPLDPSAPPVQNEPSPVLRTAERISLLTRNEAARGHRAVIRGVVTCSLPESVALVLQDSTRGIYVDWVTPALGEPPKIGDFLEIEGLTEPGEFAPLVHAVRISRLGKGELPEPIRTTWDQLINGTLDSQYVEIQGIVTAVRADGVTLLTRGGKIEALLADTNGSTNTVALKQYEGSLIRLCGCLFASWDTKTHRLRVGEICMVFHSITVVESAPEDPFAAAPKHATELLLFDSQASVLRRVQVIGQIIHERDGEYFLMDCTGGLRFFPNKPVKFAAGDLVEVVGFPSLTGPSPVLREALARKIGTAPLREAKPLPTDNLFHPEHDATRVSVRALLLNLSADKQTLELQAGLQRFVARLDRTDGDSSPHPDRARLEKVNEVRVPLGSSLELTGVYSGHGGNRTTGAEIASFELLLDSPSDIRVLARPPFWTLARLLFVLGALASVLAAALVWIRLLHQKVQMRTSQLQKEIHERENAEHQRSLALERARIARDLHDDLGSSLTEIAMIAATGPDFSVPPEEASERLGAIAGKSRTIVHALDEIVWAVDPERDTLASTARYLASYAEEYLAGLQVACRVQMPSSFPDQVVAGEHRHHLFLAVKEALTNAARHGNPTEVGFRVRLSEGRMQVSIVDDGGGFDLSGRAKGNGLLNLRHRLENLGGRCEITSSRDDGTTVCLELPLPVRNNRS
jgi:signal transduction histidine kinase